MELKTTMELKPVGRLSPTAILKFKKCPRKFFLNKIKGLPEDPSPHFSRGTMVHETIREFYKLPITDMSPDYQVIIREGWKIFEAKWKAMIEKDGN